MTSKRFEYKSISLVPVARSRWMLARFDVKDFDRQCNEAGQEGWELVSCFDERRLRGIAFIVAVFKREVVER